MIRLNRIQLFLLGFTVIMICYFARQFSFILASGRATGVVVGVTNNDDQSVRRTRISYPVVQFNVNGQSVSFRAESNMEVERGERVEVIFRTDDPSNAHIYTFAGFWLRNILWFVVPLVVWAAFSLSYLDRGEHLSLNLRPGAANKRGKDNAGLPHSWNDNKRLDQ